jgi:hypothetical protein
MSVPQRPLDSGEAYGWVAVAGLELPRLPRVVIVLMV